MSCLGNIIWFFFGGLVGGLSWFLAGILWCITIVGIPIGRQCFKFASLSFAPFGKDVVYGGGSVSGIPLAIAHLISAVLLSITIIGIPFAQQSIKLAKLALMPFGARIISK